MTWWLIAVFLAIVVGLTVGIRRVSVFAGDTVGKSTMRNHRIAELIYTQQRIPRSWVREELARGGDDAEQRAREEADWKLGKLITHFEKSSAFSDEESRTELLRSLEAMREKIESDSIRNLIAPDPRLRRTVIFLDCGDTLADEGTEIKDENEVTLSARMIPGAVRMVRLLKRAGHTLALVVDGPRGTFENILKPKRLWNLFDAYAISHEVGALKPDPSMFQKALDELQIAPDEYQNVVMVGNNLARDIKGANDLGLTTVWLDWAPRRSKTPADESEVPDYTIKQPLELIDIIRKLESAEEAE